MSAPVIAMEGVQGGHGRVSVLRGVSLRSEPDGTLAILGADGCGKSTCLEAMPGLADVTAGRVMLDGADISRLAVHRRVAMGPGFVPQTENVFGELTVDDHLRMGAVLHPAEAAGLRDAALSQFPQLVPHLRKEALLLSGGERRMLSIAQALMGKPRLLLMDEPGSDLSPKLVAEVFARIHALRRDLGLPVVIVGQTVTAAPAIADRVVVLGDGRSVPDRPARDVALDELAEIFLGRHPPCAAPGPAPAPAQDPATAPGPAPARGA
jgi:ABC-type branched-subunit amino acid transport system ATPase component